MSRTVRLRMPASFAVRKHALCVVGSALKHAALRACQAKSTPSSSLCQQHGGRCRRARPGRARARVPGAACAGRIRQPPQPGRGGGAAAAPHAPRSLVRSSDTLRGATAARVSSDVLAAPRGGQAALFQALSAPRARRTPDKEPAAGGASPIARRSRSGAAFPVVLRAPC
jgi:hypothetical protein